MLNIQKILIDAFVKELSEYYLETFGLVEPENGYILSWFGRLALENISNSDLLYHNVDHTIMVTLVGQEILAYQNEYETAPANYTIQGGSFYNLDAGIAEQNRIQKIAGEPVLLEMDNTAFKTSYKILVSGFYERNEAVKAAKNLQKQGW